MELYHINAKTGRVGLCAAKKGQCPFRAQPHFPSEAEAHAYQEKLLDAETRTGGHLIIYVGIPGSGKSTLAAKEAERLGAYVSNRDAKREELYGRAYAINKPDAKKEAAVSAILRNKMRKELLQGNTVIDDNTNLNPNFLGKLVSDAKSWGATVEIREVNVPLEVALERNRHRGSSGGRLVPEAVIRKMASKFYDEKGEAKEVLLSKNGFVFFVSRNTPGMEKVAAYNAEQEKIYPIQGKDIVVVDVDGTLAGNQLLADEYLNVANKKRDYPGFYSASVEAPVNTSVVELIKKLRKGGLTVFALTGRSDDTADWTISFLQRTGAPISRLYMAREKDFRGDKETKKDNFRKIEEEGFTVVHAIDDRPASIEVWEEQGILVSRVPYGSEAMINNEPPKVQSFAGEGFCLRCGKELPLGELLHSACRGKV